MNYTVYILTCADGTYYTGITTDIMRRVEEHNSDNTKGAKYTRPRRPVVLSYTVELPDRSTATKEELRIKKLPRKKKQALIKTKPVLYIDI